MKKLRPFISLKMLKEVIEVGAQKGQKYFVDKYSTSENPIPKWLVEELFRALEIKVDRRQKNKRASINFAKNKGDFK